MVASLYVEQPQRSVQAGTLREGLDGLPVDLDCPLHVAGHEVDLAEHHVALLVSAQLQRLRQALLCLVPLPDGKRQSRK